MLRTQLRKFAAVARRQTLAASSLMTGQQHQLPAYLWATGRKRARDAAFNRDGFSKCQLISKEQWRAFSDTVNEQVSAKGKISQSQVDWADNKRRYIDCDEPAIKPHVDRITSSPAFAQALARALGTSEWEIFSTIIWRNYPEKYSPDGREVNSTFYHVDNGGPARHRLLVNMFMYLSEVSSANGRFTYYNVEESKRINRRFVGEIRRAGNLRDFRLVEEIERFIPPRELTLEPGEAVFIDNQVCMHRAGYCTEGYRDIIEILAWPKA